MKKILSFILILVFLLSYGSGYVAAINNEMNIETVDNNIDFAIETAEMIKYADSPSLMLRIIGKFKQIPTSFDYFGEPDIIVSEDGRFVLQFETENDLLKCLEELKNDPNIIYAEQDKPIYTASLEESTEHISWGVDAIEADEYSDSIILSSEDSSVTVAIVDSGCADIDFIKSKLVQGYDFVDNDTDATNDTSVDSHGTFLASIITDCTQKLPVKIMPVRVLSSKSGSLANAINGIFYAVDNGADVINISLGGFLNDCSSLDDALAYAEQNDVSVVVCAGNSKSDIENYCPAHNETAITVSSVNAENEFSESFSNFGDEIDLSAPGDNIAGYNASGEKVTLSGTSMSAAFVSAAAAMFRLENPDCNTEQVQDSLTACTEDLGETGWDKYYGYGVLRLGKLAESKIKHVESVKFEQTTYSLYVGESLTVFPVFVPEDSTDKSFVLKSDNDNIEISGNTVVAVSEGKSVLTVISNDGSFSDNCEIIIKIAAEEKTEIKATIKIKNNSGSKTVNYGETLKLAAIVTDKPADAKIYWYVDGVKKGEGETFNVSFESGTKTVEVKLVDANGNVIKNESGTEISDSESVTVKSGFFRKIIAFFKNLFGLNRIIVQVFKGIN